jgi:hypothetical protein
MKSKIEYKTEAGDGLELIIEPTGKVNPEYIVTAEIIRTSPDVEPEEDIELVMFLGMNQLLSMLRWGEKFEVIIKNFEIHTENPNEQIFKTMGDA